MSSLVSIFWDFLNVSRMSGGFITFFKAAYFFFLFMASKFFCWSHIITKYWFKSYWNFWLYIKASNQTH